MGEELLKESDVESLKLPWWQKLLMKFWPALFMRLMARQMKVKNVIFDKLHEVFDKTERVDLFSLNSSDSRGFLLVLDQQTALYFYQDGDHFKYDGFEMGEYEKGDVTIFDKLKGDK